MNTFSDDIFQHPIQLLLCEQNMSCGAEPFREPNVSWSRSSNSAEALAILERRAPEGVIVKAGGSQFWALQFLAAARPIAEAHKTGLFVWLPEFDDDAHPYFRAGATDVVQGTVLDRSQLVRIWARLERIQSSASECQQTFRYKDLLLDYGAFRAWRAGKSVTLSTHHLVLLKTLMERPHHVFTQSELQSLVWEGRPLNEPNIRTSFQRLRRALNTSGLPELIRNVRGIGYALDEEGSLS